MTIPVIIPAYRAPEKLKRCLSALEQSIPLGLGQRAVPDVRINDEDNLLYTAAINERLSLILRHSPETEFVCVLTQDCYVRPDTLFRLEEHMRNYPKCGIVAPAQVNSAGQTTWCGSLESWPAGRHVTNNLSDFEGPIITPWVSGACMLLRVETVRECGLLDKNMRFICSDSDYSLTVRSRGWRCYALPSAVCEHDFDGSKSTQVKWLEDIKTQDVRYFTQKWFSGDLGRKLEFGGQDLTPQMIRDVLRRCELALAAPAQPEN